METCSVKCDNSSSFIMCHITTIVSGAVSLGVLAGVVSGIVYVVLIGLKWAGKLRLSLEEEALKGRREDKFLTGSLCIKCRHHRTGLLSNGSIGSEQCYENFSCNGSVCSGSGNHLSKRGSRRISENWSEDKDVDSPGSEDSNDSKTIRIREEIEKLVEEMVGGSLDGVSVGKLSEHSSYLAMFAKHHEALCQELAKLGYALHISLLNRNGFDVDSPRVAQSAVKSLVEKVVAEAMKLPNIKDIVHSQNSTEEIGNDNSFSNKSYEDILATAILNKVIEQCQKRQHRGNRKKHKRSDNKNSRNRNNNIMYYDGEADDDILYSSDWSRTSEQLSLTIEEHIEEIRKVENLEEDEFNDEIDFNGAIPFPESGRVILNGDQEVSDGEGDTHSSAIELISTGNSWEENWLFQRKRLRSGGKSHHPVPVPMLVPNPSQDFRALIGGVDADDLSDMSECSDSLLEEVVLSTDGKHEEEQQQVCLINEGNEISELPEGEENLISLNSDSTCPSLSQKERDVSVDYECFRKCEIELGDSTLTRNSEPSDVDMKDYNQPVVCRIAEREKEKWNHPVQLENNPYSPENILKREERKRMDYFQTRCYSEKSLEFPCDSSPSMAPEEATEEIPSREYYIKASRCPTGDPTIRSTPEEYEPLEEVRENELETTESFPRKEENSKENDPSIEEVEEDERMRRKFIDYSWSEGVLRNRIAEATDVILPNVKELTKKFARGIEQVTAKTSPTPSLVGQGLKAEGAVSARNLLKSTEFDNPKNSGTGIEKLFSNQIGSGQGHPSSDGESLRKESSVGENSEQVMPIKKEGGSYEKKQKSNESIKFPFSLNSTKSSGKEVHSLTARSISKEFREELKNNLSRSSNVNADLNGSGERDHRAEIVSESSRSRSPTPCIDLQSKRKFWEDIISKAAK